MRRFFFCIIALLVSAFITCTNRDEKQEEPFIVINGHFPEKKDTLTDNNEQGVHEYLRLMNQDGILCYPQSIFHWVFKRDDTYNIVVSLSDIKGKGGYEEMSFSMKDALIDNDGFYRVRLKDGDEEAIVLPGGDHIYFFPLNGWEEESNGYWKHWFNAIKCIDNRRRTFKDALNFMRDSVDDTNGFIKWDISSIVATSELSEKNNAVIYAAKNLNLRVFPESIYGHIEWYSTIENPPWVEGESGEGIGDGLAITFTKPVDSMLVLNGYVDPMPKRRRLFKDNNRINVAKITSDQFDFDFTFRDAVELSEITFPVAVDKVQLTIKKVYRGTKYNDTAITAIIRNDEGNHTWRPVNPDGSPLLPDKRGE
jgi:hypothetical protein